MKILVIIPSRFAGCGFYRQYQPYNHLAKNYDVKVEFANVVPDVLDFDIVIFHKAYFNLQDVKRVRSLGIPVVVDFDDHWIVNKGHTMYKEYTTQGTSAKLHKLLLNADYVTCTTDELADEIYKYNQNVVVLPNAVDTGYDGWNVEREQEDVGTVFGYLGGPCHTRDVALLRGVPEATHAHFRLFGYNGSDIYKHYAKILSGGNPSGNFSLFKGADIWTYPQFYNLMDVSLVPLEDNRFNAMKSELKMIEAGAFSKAVIVSKVKPYTNILRHGKNCLAAESKADWINYIKTLDRNPDIVESLGAQLKEDTKSYDIAVVNSDRYNFLQDVQQKHHQDSSHQHSGLVNV